MIPANAQSAAIKIGMVSPTTGPIAAFGEADDFILEQVAKVVGAGIANNGKTYPIQVIPKDCQSSSSRAAEVASELILGEKVDLILAADTPDVTNPVADQAEANEVPASPPTRRGSPISSAAKAIRRRASIGPIISSGASRTSSPSSRRCGSRSRPT